MRNPFFSFSNTLFRIELWSESDPFVEIKTSFKKNDSRNFAKRIVYCFLKLFGRIWKSIKAGFEKVRACSVSAYNVKVAMTTGHITMLEMTKSVFKI